MPTQIRLVRAMLVAMLIAVSVPAGIQAYAGQVPANITITGPAGTISCGQLNEFQATVVESDGDRVTQEQVSWQIVSAPIGAEDTITSSSTTDNNGVARASVRFGGTAGQRTIRASSGNAFGQIVVDPQGCATRIAVPVTVGTCASALGATVTGRFDPATEVQEVGQYITFRFAFGADFAGKPVVISRATRGIPFRGWGSFVGITIRTADANGDAYYHARSRTPAWISVRGMVLPSGGDGLGITRACQGRWI